MLSDKNPVFASVGCRIEGQAHFHEQSGLDAVSKLLRMTEARKRCLADLKLKNVMLKYALAVLLFAF
jgi:hypothetical protein